MTINQELNTYAHTRLEFSSWGFLFLASKHTQALSNFEEYRSLGLKKCMIKIILKRKPKIIEH